MYHHLVTECENMHLHGEQEYIYHTNSYLILIMTSKYTFKLKSHFMIYDIALVFTQCISLHKQLFSNLKL